MYLHLQSVATKSISNRLTVSSLSLQLVSIPCGLYYKSFTIVITVDSGLYYKHITIVKYDSSVVNKFGASLTDDARVINYELRSSYVYSTGYSTIKL
jgi:hypothetical protein